MFLLNQTTHRMVLRHSPEIGHMWISSVQARIPHEGGGFLIKTNHAGFRSDTEFIEDKSDQSRILFYGDSMTAGHGCDNHERFSDILGTSLDVQTYNYGLPGSGTDQQLLILENMTGKTEADLVVFGVYVENIQRNMMTSRPTIDRNTMLEMLVPKPYFTLTNEELTLNNVPVSLTRQPVPPNTLPQNKDFSLMTLGRKCAQIMRQSPILKKTLRPLLSPKSTDYSPLRAILPRLTGYQPVPEYDFPDEEACRLLAALIRRFQSSCNGKKMILMPIPTMDHLLGKSKANFQDFFKAFDNPENGHYVFDLHAELMQLPFAQRKHLCFDYDAHFSPNGHAKVAKALENFITRKELLPAARNKVTTKPTPPEVTYIMGISCFYHNSAACILRDGEIVAAAEEERFSRIKQDRRFPSAAINYCLEEAGIHVNALASIVFYDDPYLTFERIMATAAAMGPEAKEQWMQMMPSWTCYKLHIPKIIKAHLNYNGQVYKNFHHRSHAASAFYPSPFDRAAILTIDGVGEWTTASIGRGQGNSIELLREMHFPHSLGLIYSAFTQFLGFKVNSGEYKMMGLAPYGQPVFKDAILENLVKIGEDGSLRLQMENFDFLSKPSMAGNAFTELFGPARNPESPITQRDLDLASSIQAVTEEVVLRMAQAAFDITGEDNLVLSGGVALNCVANGRILREGPFKNLWIQPAAGDAGGALGAALDMWYSHMDKPRIIDPSVQDAQHGSLLGPAYSKEEIIGFAESHGAPCSLLAPEDRAQKIAKLASQGKVIGHFSGRLEYGPRALGSRSIIGDPRDTNMQSTLNLKIKYRESFRPFAPVVIEEKASDYFELDRPSPYMLIVAPVAKPLRLPFDLHSDKDVHETVKELRSDIPAITHVDYSARIQTVSNESNTALRDLLKAFDEQTGCAVLVNTSFNVRGEPIVNTPYEAYRCFMQTEMDALIMENCLFLKEDQPSWEETKNKLSPVQSDFDPALLRALEHLFDNDFMAAASKANSPLDIDLKKEAAWLTWSRKNAKTGVTPFPNRTNSIDIRETDLTACWINKDFAGHMTSVVSKVLSLEQQYPMETELSEEVSDQMYVMF